MTSRLTALFLTCLAFAAAHAGETRDPWLWPFAGDSIWNTPIGAGADYQGEGHFKAEGTIGADVEFHYRVSAEAPRRKLFEPQGWPVIDGQHGRFLREFQIDDEVVVRTQISNNAAAFVLANGTVEQLEPFLRMEAGGALVGIPNPFGTGIDLRGDGAIGTHWGSGLSAFGGALRHGDLTSAEPIRHALKLDVQGKRYLRYDPASRTPGYRWPATTTDGYAAKIGHGGYEGLDPRFVQGSLLAIHPRHTAASLRLKTLPAQKLFAALRDYGAYIVDDAASDSYFLCPSWEATGEFQETFGFSMDVGPEATGPAKQWYDEVMSLMTVLSVVENNRPHQIGGGGERRAAMAPPLGTIGTTPPTTPGRPTATAVSATSVTLNWSPSRDDVRVSGYRIHAEGMSLPLGETFGRTTMTVTGLKPATTYTFRVVAYDTGLNRSSASEPVSAATAAIAPGTILEDFDSGRADGWILAGAAVRSRRLELAKWHGDTSAICSATVLPASFTLTLRIEAIGGATGNVGRILLRHRDAQNQCAITFLGGVDSPITLTEVIGGTHRTLAEARGWQADRIQVRCDEQNRVSLVLMKGEARRTVFSEVAISVPAGGHLGFETTANTIILDDVRLIPSLAP